MNEAETIESLIVKYHGERDPRLLNLLTRLSKEDESFIPNIGALGSKKVGEGYSDGKLLDLLREVYAQEECVITGDYINKFAQRGDSVVKVGDYSRQTKRLKHGAEGVVCDYGLKCKSYLKRGLVPFHSGNGFHLADASNIIVFGREKRGLFRPAKSYPETLATDFNVEKGDLVRYVGEDVYRIDYVIPDKTKGMISDIVKSNYFIIWERQPGVKQSFEMLGYRNHMAPHICFTAKGFVVVRKNYVDFDKLYRECYGE